MPANIETAAVNVGQMLRQAATYQVPAFQRDYSWSEEQYGRLWEDLTDTISERRPDYFLGSMVINDARKPLMLVIDGQQRLTTICLLICALRDLLKKSGEDALAARLSENFLGYFDYTANELVSRLSLNKTNQKFYNDNIFVGANIETIRTFSRRRDQQKSNKLLAQSYLFFHERIEHLVRGGKKLNDFVPELVSALDQQITVINIRVKDDYDAYLLFETLNDRGLDLSTADLLKNYLFSHAHDSLEDIQRDWEYMVTSLGKHTITSFLRHYWLSSEGVIRDKDLYRAITRKYETHASIRRFAKTLSSSAEYYGAFSDSDNILWDLFEGSQKREVRKRIEEINLFGATQIYPLLLAVTETNLDLLASVLRMVSIFTFRYSIIGSLGTGNLEKAFSNAAKFVRANSDCSVSNIFDRLKSLYPSDADFKRDFSAKQVTTHGLARHILAAINDEMSGQRAVVTNRDPHELNLEHILLKSVPEEWLAYFDGDRSVAEQYVNRLGNMTLLESRINRQIQNSSFSDKKERAYKDNPLEINRILFDLDAWNKEAIDRRQKEMAKVATRIWRLDY